MTITKTHLAAILHHATSTLSERSFTPFDQLQGYQKDLAISALENLLNTEPKSPAELHEIWAKPLYENGWTYGPFNSIEKTHPCLVPYNDLPYHEQVKDMIWGTLIELFKTLRINN